MRRGGPGGNRPGGAEGARWEVETGEWLFLEHAAGGAGQLRFFHFLFFLSRGFVVDFLKIKAKMCLRLGSFALERFAQKHAGRRSDGHIALAPSGLDLPFAEAFYP